MKQQRTAIYKTRNIISGYNGTVRGIQLPTFSKFVASMSSTVKFCGRNVLSLNSEVFQKRLSVLE